MPAGSATEGVSGCNSLRFIAGSPFANAPPGPYSLAVSRVDSAPADSIAPAASD